MMKINLEEGKVKCYERKYIGTLDSNQNWMVLPLLDLD